MPYTFAHGGGILMLMILSVGCSAFGEGLSSAELPRNNMHEFLLNLNDSQQAANVKSSHSSRQLNGNGTFSSRHTHFKSECTNNAIGIFQGPTGYYNGIPQYTVEITNNCISCGPWDIHIFCGSFASTTLVNPATFKRIAVNDCLLNGGSALPSGQSVTFEYTNLFMYPLKFKSANFCM